MSPIRVSSLLITLVLLASIAVKAHAQGPAPLRLNGPSGYSVATIDGSGNLALRGTVASGDTTITLSAGTLEWHVSSGSTILALIPLEGPSAGSMRLRGAVHAGSSPSASHPWVFRAGGTVVASMTSAGELYLLGQLQEQALVPPAAPELLSVSALSTASLALEWTDVSGENGYRIEWSLSGASGWMPLATSPSPLATGTTNWTAAGLSPGTHYYFRVRSENEYGPSAPSNVLDGRTLAGEAGYEDYTYDGWRVLEAYEDGASGPKRQWVYGNYLDEPLVMDVDADADGNCIEENDSRYFYHQNLNYSVVGLTDAAGNLVEAYEYTPYGDHVVLSDGDSDGKVEFDGTDMAMAGGPSPLGNSCLYTGQRRDLESGLYYYKRRYYDGQAGRFVSRDPMGAINDNFYLYCDENPIINIDAYGLEEWSAIVGASGEFFPEEQTPPSLLSWFDKFNNDMFLQRSRLTAYASMQFYRFIYHKGKEWSDEIPNTGGLYVHYGECIYLAEAMSNDLRIYRNIFLSENKPQVPYLVETRFIYKKLEPGRGIFHNADHWSVVLIFPRKVTIDAMFCNGSWRPKIITNGNVSAWAVKAEYPKGSENKPRAYYGPYPVIDPTHGIILNVPEWIKNDTVGKLGLSWLATSWDIKEREPANWGESIAKNKRKCNSLSDPYGPLAEEKMKGKKSQLKSGTVHARAYRLGQSPIFNWGEKERKGRMRRMGINGKNGRDRRGRGRSGPSGRNGLNGLHGRHGRHGREI